MTIQTAIKYLKELREDFENQGEHFEFTKGDINTIEEIIDLLEACENDVSDDEMLPENCLHIYGYLTTDYNGICAVTDDLEYDTGNSIVDMIENYACRNGFVREKTKGLGGTQSIIRGCNMKIYYTNKECSLCKAQMAFDALMYGGELVTDVSKVGYSEWTITGLDLDEFTIGGHDLADELRSHMGKYIHMIIEC